MNHWLLTVKALYVNLHFQHLLLLLSDFGVNESGTSTYAYSFNQVKADRGEVEASADTIKELQEEAAKLAKKK